MNYGLREEKVQYPGDWLGTWAVQLWIFLELLDRGPLQAAGKFGSASSSLQFVKCTILC